MRKFAFLVLLSGMIACMIPGMVSAQSRVTFAENFDGDSVKFTASPTSAWEEMLHYLTVRCMGIGGKSPIQRRRLLIWKVLCMISEATNTFRSALSISAKFLL
jgi:hypothetical protein